MRRDCRGVVRGLQGAILVGCDSRPRASALLLLALLLAVDALGNGGVAAVVALRLGPGGTGPGGLPAPFGPVGGHALGRFDLDGDGDDLVGLSLPDPAVGGDVGEVAADGGDDVVVVD